MTAQLLIGPVLRRVDGDRATLWLETSEPAQVRVDADGTGAGSAQTFSAYGHHYAIVVVDGLALGSATPYRLLLDDRQVWPESGSEYPPPVIRTRAADDRDQPVSLVFGSCREATPEASGRRLPPDALDAYARRLMADPEARPDTLVLLGDQVYADETSAKVRRFLRRRRRNGHLGPTDQVVAFEEYTKLYLESWRDPEVRWLFSTVPSVMIFDDHELIDDWNTSASWRADMARQPWWRERISAGLASYWIYQHLGNLSPDELAADPLFQKVSTTDDATELLRDFGNRVDDPESAHNTDVPYQWSFALDLGRTRLIVLDNRCNRVLTPGARAMLPAAEWDWFLDRAHGDYDHLVVGSSLPWLMPHAFHHLEAWNERLADSHKPRVAALGETMRRTFDMEHWAAFGKSFAALGELFRRLGEGGPEAPGHRVGAGGAYGAPASISVLSGDVHHSYVARADFGHAMATPVYQLTCSPIHNEVPLPMRPLMRAAWSRALAQLARGLARTASVHRPALRWKRLAGPYFGNAVGTLILDGPVATALIEGTTKAGELFEVASVDYQR
ncbi:alkaline phosphatase D family protein [Actinoplanes sp. NEAU-A12]|uniref:Alkaline phosphatase D family protein n=1 Tax=Actinoplanes sandaracinus TaxID=3045177 RepID=A0ABT6WD64_9ACTN|nr:alkaline phosphatase D family protein [Actinoplanes sandaracinus]MDI6097659.1 alkaline phosphatase D family protein [Actinoplanes sandaracinus]